METSDFIGNDTGGGDNPLRFFFVNINIIDILNWDIPSCWLSPLSSFNSLSILNKLFLFIKRTLRNRDRQKNKTNIPLFTWLQNRMLYRSDEYRRNGCQPLLLHRTFLKLIDKFTIQTMGTGINTYIVFSNFATFEQT